MAKEKRTPHPSIPGRDTKGKFMPKTPLGEFNESLNVGKEVGNFPSPNKDVQAKVDQIANLLNTVSIETLLRLQNRTLGKILQVTETTQSQQKQTGKIAAQKQDVVVREQSEIVALDTESKAVTELINNGVIELLPHIKEIEKLTQLNVTYLNKILDAITAQGIKDRAGLFKSHKLLGYDPSAGSGEGGGGGGLLGELLGGLLGGGVAGALGIGAAGYGAYKALKAIRSRGAPAIPEEVPPEGELKFKGSKLHPEMEPSEGLKSPKGDLPKIEGPKIEGPKIEGPKIEIPKGLEGPKIEEGFLSKFKNILKLGGEKVATKEGAAIGTALAGGPIGLLVNSLLMALDPTQTATAKEEAQTPGYSGRFTEAPGGIPTMHVSPGLPEVDSLPGMDKLPSDHPLKMLTQKDIGKTDIPKADHIPFGGRLVPPGGESSTSVFAHPQEENRHGGIFHDWGYRAPGLSATPLGADVNPVGGGTATQMRDEGPIAPFAPSKTFQEKAPQVIGRLKEDFDLTDDQAASIVGNLGHESGGFKQLQELNPIGGGQGGYGWAQWTGPRRQDFMAWARANGVDPSSDEANYGFLKHELSNNYKGSIDALKQTHDLASGTASFEQTFEKAGIPAMGSRNRYAAAALQATKSTSGDTLMSAINEKKKVEEAENHHQSPVIINAPTSSTNKHELPQKGPMPGVRNDDPTLLQALRQDLLIT